MKYRTIKKTNDKISLLSLGAMRLDLKDETNMLNTIKYSIDNGINLIDTAYLYGNGDNEKAVGKALKELKYREKVKISTKMNRLVINSYQDMEDMLTEQLENLQTSYIDYYFIHNLTDYKSLEKLKNLDIYKFLKDKKEKGIIKNIGFSYHGSYKEFEKIVDDYNWDMVLVQYNYLDENYQAGINGINYLNEKGIGIFIMEPLKGGLLGGRMPEEIEKLLKKSDKGKIELALKWIMENENITTVLSGMLNPEMVKENIEITENNEKLKKEDYEIINKIGETILKLNKINCTGCNYCMPCPEGVYISDCFKLYNEKYLFNEKRFGVNMSFMRYFANLMGIAGDNHEANLCTKCGKCIRECPQHINIPKNLKEVNKEFHANLIRPFIPILKKLMNLLM